VNIQKVKKEGNKAIITKDDGTTFTLDLKLTENYPKELEDLTNIDLEILKEKEEFIRIKNSAYRLLSRRNHSISELREKLSRKDYDQVKISKVIKELKAINYLDDFRFAEEFVNSRIRLKKDGIEKIKNQLYKRGVEKYIITQVIKQKELDSLDDMYKNAFDLGERKLEQLLRREKSVNNLQKIRSKLNFYLKNKGYSFIIINKVVEKLINSNLSS
jgi:regulatory protein